MNTTVRAVCQKHLDEIRYQNIPVIYESSSVNPKICISGLEKFEI